MSDADDVAHLVASFDDYVRRQEARLDEVRDAVVARVEAAATGAVVAEVGPSTTERDPSRRRRLLAWARRRTRRADRRGRAGVDGRDHRRR